MAITMGMLALVAGLVMALVGLMTLYAVIRGIKRYAVPAMGMLAVYKVGKGLLRKLRGK